MNQVKKLQNLRSLSYFNTVTLGQIIGVSDNSLSANIKRWLNSGHIMQIKKGMYVTQDYVNGLPQKEPYVEFLANQIKHPSYLSMEYVLQKYNMLTDAIYAITSVSLKSKRAYRNKMGTFVYRNLTERLFTGFHIVRRAGFDIYEATKAKALFDYLYLHLYRVQKIGREDLMTLRLNLEEWSPTDQKEFSYFCKQTNIRKYLMLPRYLGKIHDS